MNKDQADKYLPIETDFVCKNNPPSWYGCRKCKYYYNIDRSRCIKQEIKEWVLYHAARAESEEEYEYVYIGNGAYEKRQAESEDTDENSD